MIDKKTIQMITERHGRVEGLTNGLFSTLVHWQGLETERVNSASHSQILVKVGLIKII